MTDSASAGDRRFGFTDAELVAHPTVFGRDARLQLLHEQDALGALERATMAILPWLIPLLMSLNAITLIPELTLWLPRIVGLVK